MAKTNIGVEPPRLMGERENMVRSQIYMVRVQADYSVQSIDFCSALVGAGFTMESRVENFNVVTNEQGVSCVFTLHSEEERTVKSAIADIKAACYAIGIGEPILVWIALPNEVDTEDVINNVVESVQETVQTGFTTLQILGTLGIAVVVLLLVKGWI